MQHKFFSMLYEPRRAALCYHLILHTISVLAHTLLTLYLSLSNIIYIVRYCLYCSLDLKCFHPTLSAWWTPLQHSRFISVKLSLTHPSSGFLCPVYLQYWCLLEFSSHFIKNNVFVYSSPPPILCLAGNSLTVSVLKSLSWHLAQKCAQ